MPIVGMSENPLFQVFSDWKRPALAAETIRRLVSEGLIEPRRPKSQLFRLTRKGVKAKLELKAGADAHSSFDHR